MATSLYKDTLERAAKSSSPSTPTRDRAKRTNVPDFSVLYLDPEAEQERRKLRMVQMAQEDDLILLQSQPGTPGTDSRPASPTSKGRRGKKEENKRDPLVRFPEEIKSRIFLECSSVQNLKNFRLVSKRWRRSATLNYCWFRLFQTSVFESPSPSAMNSHTPTWTRRESKEDWFSRYKSIKRSDAYNGPLLAQDAAYEKARSSGYRTPREEREERWEYENTTNYSSSKEEMREYYKGLHNSKTKGKGGRQGASRDRTAWEGGEQSGGW